MILSKAVSSANSGISEDDFSRMDCSLDMTDVNVVTTWVSDGSGAVMVDAEVRDETLIWRKCNCAWSSVCLDS